MRDDCSAVRHPVAHSRNVRPGQIGYHHRQLVLTRKEFRNSLFVFPGAPFSLRGIEQKNFVPIAVTASV